MSILGNFVVPPHLSPKRISKLIKGAERATVTRKLPRESVFDVAIFRTIFDRSNFPSTGS
jgi:hypothetical protein